MPKIGLSFSETSFHHYLNWLSDANEYDIVVLSNEKDNLAQLSECQGLILTGGLDIKPNFINYANAPLKFDEQRDAFEMALLEKALDLQLPILGICRGLQLINNYFGGDLILDLAEKNETHKKGEKDKIHSINIDESTMFFDIVDQKSGSVNSAHHQAINNLAKCLNISAKSTDGIIEAIEMNVDSYPFLLAVQWHPERMEDQNSPFSKNIKKAFLEKI
jgi:putative glutamine amidotransferase